MNISLPILPLLAIVFTVLKLTGHIAWSWWWVLSPLWIPFVLVLAFFLVFVVLKLLMEIFK
jgi:hypothetical protein